MLHMQINLLLKVKLCSTSNYQKNYAIILLLKHLKKKKYTHLFKTIFFGGGGNLTDLIANVITMVQKFQKLRQYLGVFYNRFVQEMFLDYIAIGISCHFEEDGRQC